MTLWSQFTALYHCWTRIRNLYFQEKLVLSLHLH